MQQTTTLAQSELILNPDGSVYHLDLLPEDVADTVITVGDPDRVAAVTRYFDSIELIKQKREFITHTGYLGNKRISVISTGISTDNIDIVFNELDALVNVNLKERTFKQQLKSLKIIRIGTTGGLHPEIPIDSFVVSSFGVGMDGMASFYELDLNLEEQDLTESFLQLFNNDRIVQGTYVSQGNPSLVNLLSPGSITGITVTCGGFYGPQGRLLRIKPKYTDFIQRLQRFNWQGHRLVNLEMETAGMYALGKRMGHQVCSISAVIANRCHQQFSTDSYKTIDNLIRFVLEKL